MSSVSPNLVEVAPAQPATESQPSRSAAYKAKKYANFDHSTTETLHDTFEDSCKKFAENACIGYRPTDASGNVGAFTFYTYKETFDKVKAFASSIKAAGVEKKQKVAVFGQNCCEWMIAMQACNRMGLVCVPLYDTLGENAIEYIMDHSEACFIVVAAAKLPAFSKALPKIKTPLKGVVYWGKDPSPEALSTVQATGIKVTPFEEFQADGAAAELPADPPVAEDLCTIMYTSGTTGDPKGVMLTHSSVVATTKSLIAYLEASGLTYSSGDSMISYLPLAHIFDRTAEEMFLRLGGSIGYWQGILTELVNDVAALRPTMFVGVPRVFDRIHQRINDRVAGSGCMKSLLFKWGFNGKLSRLNAGFSCDTAAPFWDKLVFSKIKATLGGRVRAIVSGGAPLAPHVEEFLKVVMCAPVVQGYGLTETCAASFIATPDEIKHAGTVGEPQPVTSFCLESVPDMNYDAMASPPRGELLMKGANNFQGYFKAEDKTVEVLEPSGWFHSGDVAEIMPDGQIKIIDRKKNIFKLSQGEYVAVEKLEGEYKKTSIVNQIWVYGNSFESCLVCVVVPNQAKLLEWAKSNGIESDDFATVCADPAASAYVLSCLQAQAKLSKLKGFEVVKGVHLDTVEFSMDNDLITPTFKLRRPQLLAFYKEKVDAAYQKLKTA